MELFWKSRQDKALNELGPDTKLEMEFDAVRPDITGLFVLNEADA